MNWKRIQSVVFLSLLLGTAFFACEKSDIDRTFEGPYFVRFTDSSLTYRESFSQPVAIRVHHVGPQLSEPITVNYTISGTAREGKDYAIQGTKGTVTIPANQSFGEIKVKLINNANNILESQTLTFTLTGVQPSSLKVGLGKEGVLGRSLTFTIQDDCLFGGSYTGVLKVGNQSVTLKNIAISSTDCKTYTIANWNIGLFSLNAIKVPLNFVDNGDNSLTIPAQVTTELQAGYDTVRGTGSWNPQNRQITLNLRLKLPRDNGKDTTLTLPFTYIPE
ncbi:Calx-beta domain-containing protein [Larkinella soli]|uniref:Calx-beta domain-containing protein n=1 Tax=Larkinella soli TaxID=1770527 RepID=UPI000FFBE14E|nr:Calx-beta domain-containing protein [Larkinella soli]